MLRAARTCPGAVLDSTWFDYALPLARALPGRLIEVHCTVPLELAMARYRARAGHRHAGHLDDARGERRAVGRAIPPYGTRPRCRGRHLRSSGRRRACRHHRSSSRGQLKPVPVLRSRVLLARPWSTGPRPARRSGRSAQAVPRRAPSRDNPVTLRAARHHALSMPVTVPPVAYLVPARRSWWPPFSLSNIAASSHGGRGVCALGKPCRPGNRPASATVSSSGASVCTRPPRYPPRVPEYR